MNLKALETKLARLNLTASVKSGTPEFFAVNTKRANVLRSIEAQGRTLTATERMCAYGETYMTALLRAAR